MFCCTCKVEKDSSCFGKDRHVKGGISHRCKDCKNASTRKWNTTHAEQLKAKQLRWISLNPVRYKERAREYAKNNADSITARRRIYEKERRKTDINFRLLKNLRTRVHDVLNGRIKAGSAISDLGCSIQHLKLHLELFWDEGMSWDNYGNKEGQWSIDHIHPLSQLDLTDREQFLMGSHYTNLQPLWHKDNMAKSNSLPMAA